MTNALAYCLAMPKKFYNRNVTLFMLGVTGVKYLLVTNALDYYRKERITQYSCITLVVTCKNAKDITV
jgi:hypothetical protein